MTQTKKRRTRPSRTTRLARWAASASAFGVVALAAQSPAWSATTLGLDLSAEDASQRDDVTPGGGFGLRPGQEWELLVLTLNPEISAQYSDFSGVNSPRAYRLMAGGRIGLGFIIEPSIFAHVGIGYLNQEAYSSGVGLAYDAGLALDLTLIPFMDFGIHGNLSAVSEPKNDSRGLAWGALGVHVEFKW